LSIPSRISSLAFNIFSLEPKFPICDVPTLVITDIVGFAIFVNLLNSPKWFIPISITAASWSCNLNIVNGSPILLLLFPCVFKVLYFWDTTFEIISLVLVFPTLPVTPTTWKSFPCSSLLYVAIFAIASIVSSTSIIILFSHFSRSFFEKLIFCIITAFAPFSNACSHNVLPSKFSPFIPIYVSSGFNILVSLQKLSHSLSIFPIISFPFVSLIISFTFISITSFFLVRLYAIYFVFAIDIVKKLLF